MKILVLPGMGDIYWVMVKLQDFLEQHEIKTPEIYTWELQPQKLNRSADYIKMIPFVKYGGSFIYPQNNIPEFDKIYFHTTWKIENFKQFDLLLSCNGILRNGFSLDSHGLEKYKSNWYFPIIEVTKKVPEKDYLVAYFSDDGMFQTWLKSIPIQKIYEILSKIYQQTGYKSIITGSKWDKGFTNKLIAIDNKQILIDKVGQTTVEDLFAYNKHSKGMIGWCGGNAIMSTYFKKPTLIIWSKYFPNERFYANSCPPDSLNNWYKYKVAEHTNVDDITQTMVSLLK